jgi:GT2 family glycosyltransferase
MTAGGARNRGIKVAAGEVIAFLDDDAAPEPDRLAHLGAAYHAPRVMGVGGSIVSRWESARPGWVPRAFDWVVGCTYRGMPETAAPVRNLIGCNMSFRREVFEAVGGDRRRAGRDGGRLRPREPRPSHRHNLRATARAYDSRRCKRPAAQPRL